MSIDAKGYDPALMYGAKVTTGSTDSPELALTSGSIFVGNSSNNAVASTKGAAGVGFGSKAIAMNGTTPVKLFNPSATNPFNGSITSVNVVSGTTLGQIVSIYGENGLIANVVVGSGTSGTLSGVYGSASIINTVFTTSGSITAVSNLAGGSPDARLIATFEVS